MSHASHARRTIEVCGVILAWCAAATACTQTFPEWKRGPSFMVVATTFGRPLPGVPVRLDPDDEKQTDNRMIQISDSNGIAHFQNVKPGKYYVELAYLGVEVGPGTVVVAKRGSSESIPLEWPLRPLYVVATLNGRFQGYSYPERAGPMEALVNRKPAPLALATLTVARIGSGSVIATTLTGSDGSFAFPGLEPGSYLLHIQEQRNSQYRGFLLDDYLAIEVDPKSEKDYLQLQLNMTSCGIMTDEIAGFESAPREELAGHGDYNALTGRGFSRHSPRGVIPSEARDLL